MVTCSGLTFLLQALTSSLLFLTASMSMLIFTTSCALVGVLYVLMSLVAIAGEPSMLCTSYSIIPRTHAQSGVAQPTMTHSAHVLNSRADCALASPDPGRVLTAVVLSGAVLSTLAAALLVVAFLAGLCATAAAWGVPAPHVLRPLLSSLADCIRASLFGGISAAWLLQGVLLHPVLSL